MYKSILFAVQLLMASLAMGQSQLSGSVNDMETGEPIFGANIFIQNTTVGAISDPDGKFTITGILDEYPIIVISHISYFSKTLEVKGRKVINFKLKPKVKQLKTVEIERKKDKKWKRLYSQFEDAFIGNTQNSKKVTVQNPWVMELEKNEGGLKGYSSDLLEIENRATGYTVKFLVEGFQLSNKETTYVGKPLFTPLTPANEEEQAAWEEAREKTFLGSKQHFLYALAQGKVLEEGFLIYDAEFDQRKGSFITLQTVEPEEIFKKNTLAFSRFLKVIYTREKPEKAYMKAYSSTTRIGTGSNTNLGAGQLVIEKNASYSGQVSFLFTRSSRGVALSNLGVPKNPEVLLEYGYWGWERVAELLPYEYRLELEASKKEDDNQ